MGCMHACSAVHHIIHAHIHTCAAVRRNNNVGATLEYSSIHYLFDPTNHPRPKQCSGTAMKPYTSGRTLPPTANPRSTLCHRIYIIGRENTLPHTQGQSKCQVEKGPWSSRQNTTHIAHSPHRSTDHPPLWKESTPTTPSIHHTFHFICFVLFYPAADRTLPPPTHSTTTTNDAHNFTYYMYGFQE